MRPWHLALPARRGGKCGLAKAFGVGSARRLRIAFRSTAFSPKSDASTRTHSKSPATAGRNTTGENLRKLATASSSCGELRKLSSIAPARLPQRSSFFIPAFQLEHHAFNVPVILVPTQELQALLRIAPLQNLDRLLTRAPGIHLVLVGHVKVDRVAPGKRPAVIFHAVVLSGGKQTKNRASRPPRPISRGTADLRRSRHRYSTLHASRCFRRVFRRTRDPAAAGRFFH